MKDEDIVTDYNTAFSPQTLIQLLAAMRGEGDNVRIVRPNRADTIQMFAWNSWINTVEFAGEHPAIVSRMLRASVNSCKQVAASYGFGDMPRLMLQTPGNELTFVILRHEMQLFGQLEPVNMGFKSRPGAQGLKMPANIVTAEQMGNKYNMAIVSCTDGNRVLSWTDTVEGDNAVMSLINTGQEMLLAGLINNKETGEAIIPQTMLSLGGDYPFLCGMSVGPKFIRSVRDETRISISADGKVSILVAMWAELGTELVRVPDNTHTDTGYMLVVSDQESPIPMLVARHGPTGVAELKAAPVPQTHVGYGPLAQLWGISNAAAMKGWPVAEVEWTAPANDNAAKGAKYRTSLTKPIAMKAPGISVKSGDNGDSVTHFIQPIWQNAPLSVIPTFDGNAPAKIGNVQGMFFPGRPLPDADGVAFYSNDRPNAPTVVGIPCQDDYEVLFSSGPRLEGDLLKGKIQELNIIAQRQNLGANQINKGIVIPKNVIWRWTDDLAGINELTGTYGEETVTPMVEEINVIFELGVQAELSGDPAVMASGLLRKQVTLADDGYWIYRKGNIVLAAGWVPAPTA